MEKIWYKTWWFIAIVITVIVLLLAAIIVPLSIWTYNENQKPTSQDQIFNVETNNLNQYFDENNFFINIEGISAEVGTHNSNGDGEILVNTNGDIVKTNINISDEDQLVNGEGSNFYYNSDDILTGVSKTNKSSIELNSLSNDDSIITVNFSNLDIEGNYRTHHEYGFSSKGNVFYALLGDNNILSQYSIGLDTEIIFLQPNSTDYYTINLYDVVWGYETIEEVSQLIYQENGRYLYKNVTDDDIFHANAIDYNSEKDEMYISIKNMNFIIAISLFDATLQFNPELLWILNGTPLSSFFYDPEDDFGEYPLSYDFETNNYSINVNYDPHMYDYWEGKTLAFVIDGVKYDTPQELLLMDQKYMFAGQHYVRSLNEYLSIIGYEDFNPDNTYIAIFDNHENWNDNVYDYLSKYLNNFGFNNLVIKEDNNSFVKVFEIDSTNMTATLLLNEQVEKGKVRSNALFFSTKDPIDDSIDNFLMVFSDSSRNRPPTLQIFHFDSVNTETMRLENSELIFDLEFLNDDVGIYRGQPVWIDKSNVVIGTAIHY